MINSPKTNPGHVVFVEADTGKLLGSVQVGVVPDHVTFTPDGSKVLVANEGELDGTAATLPDAADGSVSIIDVSQGFSSPTVKTAGFAAWDSAESIANSSWVNFAILFWNWNINWIKVFRINPGTF